MRVKAGTQRGHDNKEHTLATHEKKNARRGTKRTIPALALSRVVHWLTAVRTIDKYFLSDNNVSPLNGTIW